MDIEFREKAWIAYETMPTHKQKKLKRILEQLDQYGLRSLQSKTIRKIKDRGLDAWLLRVDPKVRLLFQKTENGLLIIDIFERGTKEVA